MSLAPASSRGFFLNARFAVNGIQCAARSFGTLTAAALGLLSSIGGLFGFERVGGPSNYQLRRVAGTPAAAIFPLDRALSRASYRSQIRSADPEHLAVGILGVEPQQRQLRVGILQLLAAAA